LQRYSLGLGLFRGSHKSKAKGGIKKRESPPLQASKRRGKKHFWGKEKKALFLKATRDKCVKKGGTFGFTFFKGGNSITGNFLQKKGKITRERKLIQSEL